ncbi:hypothetical protein [Deinococcus radiotolerans]|uniref:Uncharacterized protein n=1 Tax=Deinococcus radiotolerans TaxID=1309407 RepID=A0ABQ2FQE7_9DEIO|nr:hypothetical protein [Deinococcus radiotolerans]GGL16778.1 hypothetical protein GCM10010844_39630 [Deinococcus radiotolerans]
MMNPCSYAFHDLTAPDAFAEISAEIHVELIPEPGAVRAVAYCGREQICAVTRLTADAATEDVLEDAEYDLRAAISEACA